MAFEESEYLQLSGIQHFAFCRRQWALIHIENQWAENDRTVDGEIMHERAHDSGLRETRGNLRVSRGMYIHSSRLGVSGQCDVVEFRKCEQGIPMPEWEGLWLPFPVEYKRGHSKGTDADRLQLCAQAICLEDMLCCDIPSGALYYGETRRRETVDFTPELRKQVCLMLEEMHAYYRRGYTPKSKRSKSCNACSLNPICLPGIMKGISVSAYLHSSLEESP